MKTRIDIPKPTNLTFKKIIITSKVICFLAITILIVSNFYGYILVNKRVTDLEMYFKTNYETSIPYDEFAQ